MALSKTFPRVAVIGGGGYIGTRVVSHLLGEGYQVRVFDNFTYGMDGLTSLAQTGQPGAERLEILEGDICDTKAVSEAVEDCECVVLLAAIVGHRVKEVQNRVVREVNLLSSSVVLDAAIEHGARRFIFASTDSVYGIQSGVMYETGMPDPVSLYSRLKLRMEERVISAKKRSFHPTALRIATCHGYSPRMRFDLVANGLIRDAVCRRKIVIYSGEQWRSLIHVDDAARAFVSCIKAHENLISGEIFNVGNQNENLQVNHLVNIVRTMVPETEVDILEGEPDLVNYHLSSAKIGKILDFAPRWTLEASIAELKEMLQSDVFKDPYDLRYQNTLHRD